MSSVNTYSITSDLVFDEFVSSYRSDELRFKVFFGGCFFLYPLYYVGEHFLDLRLPKSKRFTYKEMNKLLLDKTENDTWKWFYCKQKCSLEEVDYYFKNLCCVDSDEEVTSMYRSHEKAKKDVSTMSFEELIAWEKKETQSPSYLRSPYVWKKTSASASKGKVLLDDFDDVANGKGKVLLDAFDDVGNGKGKVVPSYKSDEMVIEVHFGSCFFFLSVRLSSWENSRFEVTKVRKDSSTMSLEELIAWEQEKTQSPSYLRSPHVLKKTSVATSKGKVVLDDIEDVANRRGKVVLDDFADVGNGKVVFDE
nr:transposase, MuDR, MULE transposase domain protein [Tanacetum cinerariifolium]